MCEQDWFLGHSWVHIGLISFVVCRLLQYRCIGTAVVCFCVAKKVNLGATVILLENTKVFFKTFASLRKSF